MVQREKELADISFSYLPVLEEAGVNFVNGHLHSIDPVGKTTTLQYDCS